MTIRHFDGFDSYANGTELQGFYYTYSTSSTIISPTGGRYGGPCVRAASNYGGVGLTIPENEDYIVMGGAFFIDKIKSKITLMRVADLVGVSLGDTSAGVQANADGSLSITGDGGVTKGISSPGLWQLNQWFYVTLAFERLNSGTGRVYIGDTQVLEVTAADLLETNARLFAQWGRDTNGDSGTDALHYIDDIYIATDALALPTVLGDVKIESRDLTADTAQADWTGTYTGATTNDGDTSYLSATTIGHQSTFEVADMSETPSAVHAVAIHNWTSKTDAGSIELKTYVESNAVKGYGAGIAPSETGYSPFKSIYTTDPNGGGAWTGSAVNAMKIGVEITG